MNSYIYVLPPFTPFNPFFYWRLKIIRFHFIFTDISVSSVSWWNLISETTEDNNLSSNRLRLITLRTQFPFLCPVFLLVNTLIQKNYQRLIFKEFCCIKYQVSLFLSVTELVRSWVCTLYLPLEDHKPFHFSDRAEGTPSSSGNGPI